MPNQNPADLGGMNAFGRWHYGPWFWPPTNTIAFGPIPNPYVADGPWENSTIPGTPNPSMAMEAFMDTPIVNGTVYPYLEVEPKLYRFRILSVCNDRFMNLQLYQADPAFISGNGTLTEVKMVPAVTTPGFPPDWPTDGREGGVPDPAIGRISSRSGPKAVSPRGRCPHPAGRPNRTRRPLPRNARATASCSARPNGRMSSSISPISPARYSSFITTRRRPSARDPGDIPWSIR
jgi:hypothetical protein